MDCPPPPVDPIEVHPDGPTVVLPIETAQWLARRDVYAEHATACYLDSAGRLLVTRAEVDGLRLDIEAQATALQIATEQADGWERVARRRPSWGLVVGVGVAAGLGSVVAWEAVR